MENKHLKEQLTKLSLEEKAALTTGDGNWKTAHFQTIDNPAIWLSDGPHGLRKQKATSGDGDSIQAVCFPNACLAACSFDPDMLYEMGKELGEECQSADIQVLLGPGFNIKRSPLGGRDFEYYSEDPLLSGKLASGLIRGVQSTGVGACVKHYLANSQETRRTTSSSNVEERALREIYLPAFEIAIKEGKPWAVMASYNKINGVYATASRKYITDILRSEWGFEGLVMSDWGATHDRVAAIHAGTDLTMPEDKETNAKIIEAVRDGSLKESELDECCLRVLEMAEKGNKNHRKVAKPFDYVSGHNVARRVAEESIVLLKNENNILPLSKEAKIAFIGGYADKARFQGGGSAAVNTLTYVSPLEAAKEYNIAYAKGYAEDGKHDDALLEEARNVAKDSEYAVLFLGFDSSKDSEGMDKTDLNLPSAHVELLHEIAKVNPNTIVVLSNGSPVAMPWINEAKGIVELYYGGEAVSEACVDILFGKVNPSGRLAETFPLRVQDNPSYLFFPGTDNSVDYKEGVYVGYRYYTSKEMETRFPFGHGLSYSKFSYANLTVDQPKMEIGKKVTVSVEVTNESDIPGKEVVQLYVGVKKCHVQRPVRELRGFQKIFLAAKETKTVTFELENRDFSYWNEEASRFHMTRGDYEIQICKNADEVLLRKDIVCEEQDIGLKKIYDMLSTGDELYQTKEGKAFIEKYKPAIARALAMSGFAKQIVGRDLSPEEMLKSFEGKAPLGGQPITLYKMFVPSITSEEYERLFTALNQ